MKVCIYGAGASGGHFAVKLAELGHEVSVIARGPHLDAIAKEGLTLHSGERALTAKVAASEDPRDFGPQDVVIVGVKSVGLPSVAHALAPLVSPETLVVFPQNGMPWWYHLGLSRKNPTPDIPIFGLAETFKLFLKPQQVVGGIVYSANVVKAPGLIWNNSPGSNRLDIAPIVPGMDGPVHALRDALKSAGIASPEVDDIRRSVWKKLVVNMSGSTIGLVTRHKSSIARDDRALGTIYTRAVREGMAIAAAEGFDLSDTLNPDTMRARLIDHEPSILQDYERGRRMEIGEILVAPLAFARQARVETPVLHTLAAIAIRQAADKDLFTLDERSAKAAGLSS